MWSIYFVTLVLKIVFNMYIRYSHLYSWYSICKKTLSITIENFKKDEIVNSINIFFLNWKFFGLFILPIFVVYWTGSYMCSHFKIIYYIYIFFVNSLFSFLLNLYLTFMSVQCTQSFWYLRKILSFAIFEIVNLVRLSSTKFVFVYGYCRM